MKLDWKIGRNGRFSQPQSLSQRLTTNSLHHINEQDRQTEMKYNISKPTPPAMPNLGKNTKNLPFLLSQSSKGMHQSLVTKLFPIL